MVQVTLITGGGRGIGRAIALRMAQITPIVVVGRTESDLSNLCEMVMKTGGNASYFVGDISDPDTAKIVLTKLQKSKKFVANLVCNAGIAHSGLTHTFDSETWKRMFAVNVDGAFFFAQAFLPSMIVRNNGTIIFMSSILGVQGYKYQTAYSATKHALVGMAKSMAMEYAKYNIQVVPVCPSFVESDMTERTVQGLIRHQGLTRVEALEKIANINPQKRILPAEEVAEMVAFICQRKVPALNGNPVLLTGGG